ncbi:MAG: glycosyltransferase family 1 protein [Calditrichaeota bacterium]|nr:glycosyltransferase family 1 protein [Calditrichota bacterium]
MDYVGSIKVIPRLPEELQRLKELAYNLYFSWNPEARQLFRQIDPELWKRVNHNPVKFLQEVQQHLLEEKSRDPQYLALFKKVMVEYDQYMKNEDTWFSHAHPEYQDKIIAYFSAEFGFHESLPIYAGGLGVLAGDHLKSASDLGIPLVGVSLFYHQTYFTQQIDAHGNQISLYVPYQPEELPLHPVLDEKGKPIIISVEVGPRIVKVRIWKAQVGRVAAYLLDTNIPENTPEDRMITARLYGGDQEMRISQEIVLGMGGVKALKRLNIHPDAWHMNEGHSVFLSLERIRDLVKSEGLKFHEALEAVAANTIFTTHTPVPAGNDAFPAPIKEKYFQKYWQSVGIKRSEFMELGSQAQPEGYEIFNLTILSLKLSRFRNGVSELHGKVSRQLWHDVWKDIPEEEVPITHITNGVHNMTWTVRKIRELFDDHLGQEWRWRLDDPDFWRAVQEIPDEALWQAKMELKEKMLQHVRERLRAQFQRNRIGTLLIRRLEEMLKPEILTIGFARRFATYKRGTLIFRDPERLKRILNHPERPVQIIFAGKAHPRDEGGKALIRTIYEYSMKEGFQGKIFFVEGYDMSLARDLVSGADVWLNNPRRPQEASGTSGQKVGLNAGINFSVLDGWWVEGYNGKNGWAFGDQEDFQNLEELDDLDAAAIYDILENDIIPAYYERDEAGLPRQWIQIMKQSIMSILPIFNTHRMVKEYVRKLYIPAMNLGRQFRDDHFKLAKTFAAWRERIETHWAEVSIEPVDAHPEKPIVLKYQEAFKVKAIVRLGEAIQPGDVKVQVFLEPAGEPTALEHRQFELIDMSRKKTLDDGSYLYEATIVPRNSGNFHYTFRVLPYHPSQANPVELGLACWAHRPSD